MQKKQIIVKFLSVCYMCLLFICGENKLTTTGHFFYWLYSSTAVSMGRMSELHLPSPYVCSLHFFFFPKKPDYLLQVFMAEQRSPSALYNLKAKVSM